MDPPHGSHYAQAIIYFSVLAAGSFGLTAMAGRL